MCLRNHLYLAFAKSLVVTFAFLCCIPTDCFAQRRGATTLAYQLTHVDTGEPFPSPDGKKIAITKREVKDGSRRNPSPCQA